jgi:hypothetical protein
MKFAQLHAPKRNKVALKYKEAKYKRFKTYTLILFAYTFKYNPVKTL